MIPVGTQFTPALVRLRPFLRALVKYSGDKTAIEEAVWSPAVRTKPAGAPTKRRKSLPVEAARQYSLLDKEYRVTKVTAQLASLEDTEIKAEFAKHILLRLNGLRVVEGATQMKLEGYVINGDSLAEYLTDQGFRVTIHNTAINSLRMWLAEAGVFRGRSWDVDEARLEAIIGLEKSEIAGLATLSEEQQAFLIALCRVDPRSWCSAAEIRQIAEQILSRRIPRDSLPKRILNDLRDAGYLEFKSGGTSGGKAAKLRTLEKFRKDVLAPFLEDAVKSLDPVLTAYFETTPADIYKDLSSPDKGKKGKALEAYAIHLMRLMGFRFVGWRKRAQQSTGRAEVDAVMTGVLGNAPTRWQVQCKNTPSSAVDLEDVAREVGVAAVTKATHVFFVANCRYTSDARRFAAEVMKETSLTLFLLDKEDFRKVRKSPGALAGILRARASEINKLQRSTTMWGW